MSRVAELAYYRGAVFDRAATESAATTEQEGT